MSTAFIFPGQGAQYIGMGKDFYNAFKVSRDVFDCASDVLHLDMCKLCFEENERLDITEYTQAALFTTCVAMYEALKAEKGVQADVTAGLSLGEYCAIYTSGAFTFEEGIRCVRQRGLYMQEAVPLGEGAMSAVLGMDAEKIEKICEETEGIVTIANYNCPGQVVISGETRAVRDAGEKMRENAARGVVPLNVSGPFHSPMLRGAGEKLRLVLESIHWKNLNIPYVANINAEYVQDIGEVKELLVRQVCSPVRWQQSVETMIYEGVNNFVEIGPGKTLKKFLKKISKEVKVSNIGKVKDL